VKSADLEALKSKVAQLERGSSPAAAGRFATGSAVLDAALRGGLERGALHEIFAPGTADAPSAAGFAIALALRAADKRPVLWVRQDFAGVEAGEVHAPGLMELGLSPERLILVRARDGPGVLRAGEEAARCPPLGAVLIELWGKSKALDLAASRRLGLAAARSNLPLFMVRAGADPAPSAASTRWQVHSALSVELEANAPGHPAFAVSLLRHRGGASGQTWIVEWDRDQRSFRDLPAQGKQAVSGGVVPLPAGGPGDADGANQAGVRQAG
jgi:protein ImuA